MAYLNLSIHTDNQALKKQLAVFLDEKENLKKKADKNVIIDMVATHIARINDQKQVYKFVSENFKYHDNINRTELLGVLNTTLMQDKKRKDSLKKTLSDYLAKHSKLNIEGFLNFRLKEYNAFLNDSLETITEDYLIEKEYEEFISLLAYFIEAQEPLLYRVHILPTDEERYRLFDENEVEMTNFCIREFLAEMTEERMNFDDFLLSTLISLAPREITLHHPEAVLGRNVITTIQKVFGENLSYCDDCAICNRKALEKQIFH